jgi:hypothetical protein
MTLGGGPIRVVEVHVGGGRRSKTAEGKVGPKKEETGDFARRFVGDVLRNALGQVWRGAMAQIVRAMG